MKEWNEANPTFGNPIIIQSLIKVYFIYWILLFNVLAGFLFINLWSFVDFYIIVFFIGLNSFDWFMILVIVLVSSIVILNPIDYLSLMESYLFLIYPSLLQFSMIRRVFPNDLIITFVYWDWLGLLSYLPTNFRSVLNSLYFIIICFHLWTH